MRVAATALSVISALCVCTPGAQAYFKAAGTGSGSGAAATVGAGEAPTLAVSGTRVTVTWVQTAFGGRSVGAAGGGYVVTRYADATDAPPVTPGAACDAIVSGSAATLSCQEAGVPYGDWRYTIAPVLGTFTGAPGLKSAVASVRPAAPALTATEQNPAAGQGVGTTRLEWTAVPGATGYDVFRRTAAGSHDFGAPLNGAAPLTGLSTVDATGTGATEYFYVVRAVAGSPEVASASSPEGSAIVRARPQAPTSVTATPSANGPVTVSWPAVGGAAGYNVYRRPASGTFDAAPLSGGTPTTAATFTDADATSGQSYVYGVRAVATGAGGAQLESLAVTSSAAVTARTCATASSYATRVTADAPYAYFRLGDALKPTAADSASTPRDGTYVGGVTLGRAGALKCDGSTAIELDGATGHVTTSAKVKDPQTFTLELWFKTTVGGGRLVGFGNASTGASTQYDRHVYLTDTGQVVFGVYSGAVRTVASPGTYLDGQWHMVGATLGATGGMRLYVDGALVGADATVKAAQYYAGFWRLGYDNLAGWPSRPSRSYFSGQLDEAAIFASELPAATVAAHFTAGGY